jgi:chromosome segregation ATPase
MVELKQRKQQIERTRRQHAEVMRMQAEKARLAAEKAASAADGVESKLRVQVQKLRDDATRLQASMVSLKQQVQAEKSVRATAERALKRTESEARQAVQRASSAEEERAKSNTMVTLLTKLDHGEYLKQLSLLTSRLATAEKAREAAAAASTRASTLNTENKELRAQLKRTVHAGNAAASSSDANAAELKSYQLDMRQRVAGDDSQNWSRSSAASTSALLAFEVRRGEIERQVLIDELSSRLDMPEERLYDKSTGEFRGRTRLACIGAIKRGASANRLPDLLAFLARELFCVNLPFYSRRNR